jgi:hypothetical protein
MMNTSRTGAEKNVEMERDGHGGRDTEGRDGHGRDTQMKHERCITTIEMEKGDTMRYHRIQHLPLSLSLFPTQFLQ